MSDPDKLTKIGHAVALLNNHIPSFGARYYHDADDRFKEQELDRPIDQTPSSITEPLIRALASAARFLAREFDDNRS